MQTPEGWEPEVPAETTETEPAETTEDEATDEDREAADGSDIVEDEEGDA